MNTFTNYLEKLGSNFLVSAMVPSFALVITSILVFDPILHVTNYFKDEVGAHQLIGFGLIIFTYTVIIGFTLTALNTYILKFFEGYVVFWPVKFLYLKSSKIHRQKAFLLQIQRDSLAKEIEKLEQHPIQSQALKDNIDRLKDKYYKAASGYDQAYPENLDEILPTQFGNTLKAAEDHSAQRYGFDGVTFWPRLVYVIPAEYKSTIDGSRNELSFLVNMSLLSLAFSSFCILALFSTMGRTFVVSADAVIFSTFAAQAIKYLIAAALGIVSCIFFYRASIISLGTFAHMIRASFDLFRLDLLKKFELIRPNNSIEEFNTWKNLNELILLGSHSLSFKQLDFCKEKKDKT